MELMLLCAAVYDYIMDSYDLSTHILQDCNDRMFVPEPWASSH